MAKFTIGEIEKYEVGKPPKQLSGIEEIIYEPRKGEIVNVIYWVRYPEYDFIFGVPDQSSPKHEKEIGFFQFRDTRAKKVLAGCYIDIEECKEMIIGFSKILDFSKENSKHLWKQDLKKG